MQKLQSCENSPMLPISMNKSRVSDGMGDAENSNKWPVLDSGKCKFGKNVTFCRLLRQAF